MYPMRKFTETILHLKMTIYRYVKESKAKAIDEGAGRSLYVTHVHPDNWRTNSPHGSSSAGRMSNMYREVQKNTQSLMRHHFATIVCSIIMRFSPKCTENITICHSMQNLYHLVKIFFDKQPELDARYERHHHACEHDTSES